MHMQVRREYADFEKLQRDLLMAFPELKLPAFPRKFHVFMNESDNEERMVSFDCIVKIVARHKAMCTSPTMLEFLGFERTSHKKYFKVSLFHLCSWIVHSHTLRALSIGLSPFQSRTLSTYTNMRCEWTHSQCHLSPSKLIPWP